MIPTEEQINSQLKKLEKFKFEHGKSKLEDLIAWANSLQNLLSLILTPNNLQLKSLRNIIEKYLLSGEIYGFREAGDFHTKCLGIFKAVHSDFKAGFLKDLRAEIRAEVDTDFLSQSKRLLDDNQKDPAAMIIGAVLEDTLRQLCQKYGVPEERNIESMNVPLKKAGAYNLTVQKQITAWAGIRNDADHALFDNYVLSQVELMYQGVLDFVAKYLI